MKTAIVIEDEKAVAQNLIATLKEVAPDTQIKTTLSSVRESIDYLSQHNNKADIIFCDVQLTDGLSFSIFNEVNIDAPIIFITGYDKFMLNAFEYNSIDYLLKPVCREDLQKALEKYKRLEQHFTNTSLLNNFLQHFDQQKKTRLLVKKGLENISLLLEDVVLFFTENKIVYVIDKTGRKYLIDKNLSDLEVELDNKTFFRVNRQYIININYIRSFKAYERVKLQIELTVTDLNYFIVVSQETAPLFRKWISES
jgi:DNA-binding LytR/AlgR family response regulator